jgi:hypothetical protein
MIPSVLRGHAVSLTKNPHGGKLNIIPRGTILTVGKILEIGNETSLSRRNIITLIDNYIN